MDNQNELEGGKVKTSICIWSFQGTVNREGREALQISMSGENMLIVDPEEPEPAKGEKRRGQTELTPAEFTEVMFGQFDVKDVECESATFACSGENEGEFTIEIEDTQGFCDAMALLGGSMEISLPEFSLEEQVGLLGTGADVAELLETVSIRSGQVNIESKAEVETDGSYVRTIYALNGVVKMFSDTWKAVEGKPARKSSKAQDLSSFDLMLLLESESKAGSEITIDPNLVAVTAGEAAESIGVVINGKLGYWTQIKPMVIEAKKHIGKTYDRHNGPKLEDLEQIILAAEAARDRIKETRGALLKAPVIEESEEMQAPIPKSLQTDPAPAPKATPIGDAVKKAHDKKKPAPVAGAAKKATPAKQPAKELVQA